MKLVLHTGVHFTEEDRMMKCLLRNADDFATKGVMVPGQGKYRSIMRDTLNAMASAPPSRWRAMCWWMLFWTIWMRIA
ncbi:hypothetical protein OAI26_04900 [Sulfitobacter sp.]|nr:hypothetical protein [Sulfitobacter sp.]